MVIQFICRGNAFRSIIAEAYMNSLQLADVTVLSSGTRASKHKQDNIMNHPKTIAVLKKHGIEQYAKDHYADDINQELLDKTDVAVCVNKLAYDEATAMCTLPPKVYTWNVIDLGEVGRIANTEAEREGFIEDAYQEIVKNVDELVAELKLKG